MSKTVLADVDGFTPVIDDLIEEMGLMSSVVFGRIWRYCQMEDGVCKASLETIGDGIGVDKATVMRHAKELCEAGYLKDLTPELRNRPHVYADTGKAGLKISVAGVSQRKPKKDGVAERKATVAQSNVTVAESQLNKELKKDSKKDFNNINNQSLELFASHFGKFKSQRELERWALLFDSVGDERANALAVWASKKEIHLTNRPGLIDSMETAAKNWQDHAARVNGKRPTAAQSNDPNKYVSGQYAEFLA
jgi:DNA-binding Lrp family transcriptional regulator